MYRVVLADDSTTIQKVVHLSFPREEYHVDCLTDGHSAWDHILQKGADVVLVDVALPGMDGYSLCNAVKSDPLTRDIPIVLLSSSLEPVDDERAGQSRFNGILAKPFETSELVNLVEALVSRSRPPLEDRADSYQTARHETENAAETQGRELPEGILFELSRELCRPRFLSLVRRKWIAQSAASDLPPGMTEEQFRQLLDAVQKRLPDTLRQILPQVSKEVLGTGQ